MFAMQRIKTQVLTICEGEFTRQQRQLSGESQISRSILACIIEADFQQSAGEGIRVVEVVTVRIVNALNNA